MIPNFIVFAVILGFVHSILKTANQITLWKLTVVCYLLHLEIYHSKSIRDFFHSFKHKKKERPNEISSRGSYIFFVWDFRTIRGR